MSIRVQVVRAWPRRHQTVELRLEAGATVADALAASGLQLEGVGGYAVYGERADAGRVLREGDRVELLQPLLADPKQARRRRALRNKE
ncbi:RnfH family protein [Luteimonas aquatica]|uniref:RnfH family protein n=1 Tax=Luteimonas aquatica TaxID=450364 RepID=UPI001F568BB4|nr:RnfH family protein [Luteimonas aquatica]